MKHFKLIISTVCLLLAAFCCVNNIVETQQAATAEPYIKPDSAFVSQSQAFAEEHKWVSFTLCRARHNTCFWNDLYRFHNISFENKQLYIDSILMANS
ncbi:MAG: hypothetical protein II401_08470 [Bacteroidales bacterium]|nr:hypothetical protein [Bacteroidales bacterium]